jgi:hypothetical protein
MKTTNQAGNPVGIEDVADLRRDTGETLSEVVG